MWGKVFDKIPQDHFYFYAPQIASSWFQNIPGIDIRILCGEKQEENKEDIYANVLEKAIQDVEKKTRKDRTELKIVYLVEGPYEVQMAKINTL